MPQVQVTEYSSLSMYMISFEQGEKYLPEFSRSNMDPFKDFPGVMIKTGCS